MRRRLVVINTGGYCECTNREGRGASAGKPLSAWCFNGSPCSSGSKKRALRHCRGEELVDAVEVGSHFRGRTPVAELLNRQVSGTHIRGRTLGAKPLIILVVHLRFQRTVPSLASSRIIPRSARSLRMRSLAATSRRWRAA